MLLCVKDGRVEGSKARQNGKQRLLSVNILDCPLTHHHQTYLCSTKIFHIHYLFPFSTKHLL